MELDDTERALQRAEQLLAQRSSYESEEWMLLATLVGEADLAIRQTQNASAELRALRDNVVAQFRDVTEGFTKPEFTSATGAARRRNKELFSVRA